MYFGRMLSKELVAASTVPLVLSVIENGLHNACRWAVGIRWRIV